MVALCAKLLYKLIEAARFGEAQLFAQSVAAAPDAVFGDAQGIGYFGSAEAHSGKQKQAYLGAGELWHSGFEVFQKAREAIVKAFLELYPV